jgi:hypothetical protein
MVKLIRYFTILALATLLSSSTVSAQESAAIRVIGASAFGTSSMLAMIGGGLSFDVNDVLLGAFVFRALTHSLQSEGESRSERQKRSVLKSATAMVGCRAPAPSQT